MSDWHAIVVEGGEGEIRGFVAGFLADRQADPASVVLGDDVGLEHESLVERLRALVKGGHHALLVPHDLAAPLVEALWRVGGDVGLRVADRHPIAGAHFDCEAEVYARDVSSAIRAALAGLPDGVHFERHAEHEEAHDGHTGVELYAPVHDYTYRVKARVAGPLAGVLAVRRRLEAIEAVTLSSLHLV
jgi:hypothetical protein